MGIKDNYYTLSEAAKELDVTRQTVFRWIKDGKMPAEKMGRETLIEKSVVIEQRLKNSQDFMKAMIGWFLVADDSKLVREQLSYDADDIITMLDADKYVFLITRKDGRKEIAEVGSIWIGYNQKGKKVDMKIVQDEVERYPYEEWKKKTKSKKPK
jgi:excisionase family DNA binding protein